MNLLGIYDGHNSSAALIRDGRVVVAVEEERYSRVKNHDGRRSELTAPRESVLECVRSLEGRLDAIAVALAEPQHVAAAVSGLYQSAIAQGLLAQSAAYDTARVYGDVYDFQSRRIAKITTTLRSLGISIDEIPLIHIDHHHAHAASAYYNSGRDEALVVTLDGKGDNLSGTVSLAGGGRMRRLLSIDHLHSLGHFYSAVTAVCGFLPLRDEGKTTGLAAYAAFAPDLLRKFHDMIEVREGRIISTLNKGGCVGPYPNSVVSGCPHHVDRIAAMTRGFDRPTIAATAQRFLEDLVIRFLEYHLAETGARHLLVAGGVFANVRLNQRIAEHPGLDSLAIHPAMSDAGLAVGAAQAAYFRNGKFLSESLPNVFLGPAFTVQECTAAVERSGLQFFKPANVELEIAKVLAAGESVCRFTGRLEYGPRALGNRSILHAASNPGVRDVLNQRLDRTETMPFAPATLEFEMEKYYHTLKSARASDEFMTITYDCTNTSRHECSAIVHLDGTARPQRVCRHANPSLYSLLSTYQQLTGVGTCINTSFNRHDEPIVCSPTDAINTFQRSGFRYLQLETLLVKGGIS